MSFAAINPPPAISTAAIAIAAILIAGGGLIAAKDMVWKRSP